MEVQDLRDKYELGLRGKSFKKARNIAFLGTIT